MIHSAEAEQFAIGSGTVCIQCGRPDWGRHLVYEHLSIYNQAACGRCQKKRRSVQKSEPMLETRITGSDIDPAQIERAQLNGRTFMRHGGASVAGLLAEDEQNSAARFYCQRLLQICMPPFPEGLILCNPPYGERIGDEKQAEELYKSMASLFVDFPGWADGCHNKP